MNVDRADTPIVILRRGKLLRNPSNAQLAAELAFWLRRARPICAIC